MSSTTENQSLEGASSHPDIFPFEKLPAELRVKVYEYTLVSPCGWFNITWDWYKSKACLGRSKTHTAFQPCSAMRSALKKSRLIPANVQVVRPRISLTEDLSRTELLSQMSISMLYLNSEPTLASS